MPSFLPTGGAVAPVRAPLGDREFVVMMAALMALNALAIDIMLPALPLMAEALGASGNDQQSIISMFFMGMALGSLVHGPLADRFGRRNVILVCLTGYVFAALLAGYAPSWHLLLAMRFVHGFFGAAMGVVATAIVRDRTSGDAMARLMSMIFLIFMIVPIIAPSVGQAVLWVAPWQTMFVLLGVMGLVMAAWVWLRLPETMSPQDAQPIQPATLARNWRQIATHRTAFAYMLASSLAVGANFGFLNSAQQIISQTFGRADIFPYLFAIVAAGIAVANFSNSKVVLRFGARRVGQAAVVAFILLSFVQWFAASRNETLTVFLVLLTLNMGMIGFIGANFSSIAMEPFGKIAGTASSFQNAFRTLISAAVGYVIGQQFDGTTLPLTEGYMVCGTAALIIVAWGERGRLFTRPNAPHQPPVKSERV
jgi:MFS transporter, DHA1 family, multidrug resistance protein